MNTRGFSLIEVVIAIGIFAFAAITMLTLLGRGMQSSRESRMDNAAAILSGRIVSLLKASYAWTNSAVNPEMTNFMGPSGLQGIASGGAEVRTNYYDIDLQRANQADADFQVVTDIRPLNQGFLSTASTNLQLAIGRFADSKNAVFASVNVSFPARITNEALRSKRDFATIITIRSDE